MIKLSVVILNFRTVSLTTKCISSLFNNYKKEIESGDIEVIVADNASDDGSVEKLKKIKNIKLIANKENYGFGKGCNMAGNVAKGDYVLFLNSDTKVLDKGFLKMVEFLEENKNVGILGGRLLNLDNSLQKSAGKFYTLFFFILMLLSLERFGILRASPSETKRVDWVSGACMMVRRNLFEKLKGFDEGLFMYVEDMELCYRAKKMGFSTYFYPHVRVMHQELGSSNRTFAVVQIYKGLLYFYKVHRGRWEYSVAKALLIAKARVAIIVGKATGNSYLKSTYKKAIRF